MLLLNYTPVLRQPTGIGVYANAILPALEEFDHFLISGGGSGGSKDRLKRLAWTQFQLRRIAGERKADLIFTPAPEGYLGEQSVPQVLMVHDLRPLSHPESSMQSLYFRNWVPPLLRSCKHVITNSNFTASEIRRLTGVHQSKISVTPLGYDAHHFCPSRLKTRLHDRHYLLHVGQPYPHKNLQLLIQAYSKLCQRFPEVDLILLGKPHSTESARLEKLVSELNLLGRVFFKKYVSYEDLPNWYRGALAFIYPSLWEGFGLPILEAMACGCPVIASHGTGSEETASSSAKLIDPFSLTDLTESITQIVSSDSLRQSLVNRGHMRANEFSWNNCRQKTCNVLNRFL